MCLNMVRNFLKNKQIIYSAYFWEIGNGEKDQYIEEKEIFVFILYPFVLNLLLPKAHTADFKLA